MGLSRRNFVIAGTVLATIPITACSAQTRENGDARLPADGQGPAGAGLSMAIHRDPGCPCCDKWAELARAAGYQVTIADDPAIAERKRKWGVPQDLWSCHTTEAGGFVFEGHVPLESVARLLAGGDRSTVGLAVAGMPLGSPGMETASGAVQPYQVIAFYRSGERRVFAEYGRTG
jgi:hypothetical protein